MTFRMYCDQNSTVMKQQSDDFEQTRILSQFKWTTINIYFNDLDDDTAKRDKTNKLCSIDYSGLHLIIVGWAIQGWSGGRVDHRREYSGDLALFNVASATGWLS